MGIAGGVQAGLAIRQQREGRIALKKQREEELLRQGYSFKEGQMQTRPNSMAEAEQLQAKETAQLAKGLQGKLSAQESDRGMEEYALSGDASYLQKALDNDPELKKAWAKKGVLMVGNIDFTNDAALLSKAGFRETAYDTEEKRDVIKKSVFKKYDGKEWSIGLANKAAAETGASSRMGARRSQPGKDNHKALVDLLGGPKSSANTAEGHKYENAINAAAAETEIPANLIAAMISQESGGREGAVSSVRGKDYTGLMQVGKEAAAEVGITDRNASPEQNILAGTRYLKKMLDRYDGDMDKALAAYNAGPGNVDKYGGIPPFSETQNYVNKIKENFDKGEQYYGGSADQTISTILEHRKNIALASQGKSEKGVASAARLDLRKVAQKDLELDIKQQAVEAKLKTEGTTTKQKDLAAAETHTNKLVENFGGSEEFFKTDFQEPKNYRKAYAEMVKIERLEDSEPSEADKKEMTDLRLLTSLSTDVQKLTTSETGLIDKNLGALKKYFKNNVKGVASKSAWAAFRNIYVHAMSGTALTETEAKRNAEALGKLGTKLGPALEMFNVSLNQVGSRLDSVSKNMNPYSAKIRLGSTIEELQTVQDNIRRTIEYTQGIAEPTQERKSLDSIFKD